ncbi:CAP domain-containing protein [Altererythrobacter sp. MTPC7]|uniref:CAP domain-containing protein n=1 Tax=Altererythrobacter sp. MTPC7 TaxID=3056567 RepID=UPI0036F268CE
MRSIKPVLTAAALLLGAQTAMAQDAQTSAETGTPLVRPAEPAAAAQQINMFAQSLLGAHNDARQKVGAPPLRWSAPLQDDAARYAAVLAEKNMIEHASAEARKGAGENLWIGTTGFYSTRAMIDAFLSEERYFKPGVFPDVSTTGNWIDVGHYTQIIWKDTQEVGCAIANNSQNDVLVCRYMPSGNWRGVAIP